jgi:dimethylargininase
MLTALTREISPSIARCELTHLARAPIDLDRARAQHAAYARALAAMGCSVERLAAGDEMPDSVFVEDTAVVFDELAIITRPGAESRRRETDAVAQALHAFRPLIAIEPPGTIDGGDVLVVGRAVFVGTGGRTNAEAVAQMGRALAPFGYDVRSVHVSGCLHLKSAVTALDDETLLINRRWAPAGAFSGFALVDVHDLEPAGANVLRVANKLLYAAAFPRTCDLLVTRGFHVGTVDLSELAKAEGAVTCCSILLRS